MHDSEFVFLYFEIIIKLFLVVEKMRCVLQHFSFMRTIEIKIKMLFLEKTQTYTIIRHIKSYLNKEQLKYWTVHIFPSLKISDLGESDLGDFHCIIHRKL